MLIDTGANKNIVQPGILNDITHINDFPVKNVSGTFNVTQKGKLDLFDNLFEPFTFYELKFHNFFNCILGSETMARLDAKIDYKRNHINLKGNIFKFSKFFPTQKQFNHIITVDTCNDGDWLVPQFQKICKDTFIQPGLYRAKNGKSTIRILSNSKNIKNLPKISLSVNNFETLTPVPISTGKTISKEEIKQMIRSDHLSPLEATELLNVIHENQSVLLKEGEKLSATTAIKHKIVTVDDCPIYTKSYRYPHHFKKDVHQQIQEMLDNGIIQPSVSPYSAPIWVVPKKQDASGKKKVRVVIDYRRLNEKTIDDRFPMPQIEEILDNLGKSVYFTTLDLKSGFHQIPMDPAHKEKTAFSTDKGHFEFNRMPFGLKNAPATFQRAMNNILGEYIGTICYVYLDDIVIVGYNLQNHLENLKRVLRRLSEFNLKIQLDKCEFLKRETEFLGHVITSSGVKPNPEKIEKIVSWPLPKNQKEIKQFLGLAGYYRRFIKDFSKITRPMTKYLKKDQPINLQDESYIHAFETLKQIISTDQVLSYPQFDKPFILTTDASDYAVGAVLSQIQDKVDKPIAFASRTLNDVETRYATIEKEALAIVWAINKFKPYLYGAKFTLLTDHKPLTFLKNSSKNDKILRWALDLKNYTFDVLYKEGKTNVVADALSRRPNEINVNESNTNQDSSLPGTANDMDTISQLNNPPTSETHDSDLDTVHSADDSSDLYIHYVDRPINYYHNQIIFRIARFTTVISETVFPHFKRTIIAQPYYNKPDITKFLKEYHNGRQTAILAPEDIIQMIQECFKEHFNNKTHFVLTSKMVEDVTNQDRQNSIVINEHDRAHRGTNEVEAQIRRSFFFPNMAKLIKAYSDSCPHCNKHKYERKPYNIKITPRPITDKPLERVHMDIFIIANHSFLSLIDAFSKHLQMNYIRTKNLAHVQKALTKYFSSYGIPRKIVTDHETTFRSIQMRNFLGQLGCCIEYASSSESNGQIERTHSTIIEIYNTNKYKFRTLGTKSIVKIAVALYNETVHSSTKLKPNEIMFNMNNSTNLEEIISNAQKLFEEAKTNMLKASYNQTKGNDSKEDPPNIQEQENVFVRPNIRTKTEPRAVQTTATNIEEKTFINSNNVKRHKQKIKRLRKNR